MLIPCQHKHNAYTVQFKVALIITTVTRTGVNHNTEIHNLTKKCRLKGTADHDKYRKHDCHDQTVKYHLVSQIFYNPQIRTKKYHNVKQIFSNVVISLTHF